VHRAEGYHTVVRLLTGLPADVAPMMEDAVRATLRLARMEPIRGREYFDADALVVILDVVDNYPVGAFPRRRRGHHYLASDQARVVTASGACSQKRHWGSVNVS
jgi:hypothetical protein